MYKLIYLMLVGICFICVHPKIKHRTSSFNFRLIICIFLFSLYSAILTSDLLYDRKNYDMMFLSRFQRYTSLKDIFNTTIEPGYIILNQIIHIFTGNVSVLYFVITFIVLFTDIKIIRKITSRNEVLFYYFISFQFFWGTYLIRQAIAAILINVAFYFLVNKKFAKTVLLTISSTLFHASAIIMLPIFIFLNNFKKLAKKKFIVMFVLAVILFAYDFILPIVFKLDIIASNFMEYESISSQGNLTIILKGIPYHLIALFALLKSGEIEKNLSKSNYFVILSLINSFFWSLSYNFYWLYRLSMYTAIPSLVLIPYIIDTSQNKYIRFLLRILIIGSMMFLTFREIFITL
jgi:transmembrane protein EpsG